MALRRARSFRGGGKRRGTTWIGPADQGYVAVATNTKVLVGSFDPFAVGMINPTLIRTRGGLSVIPGAFTADVAFIWAYGIGIVSDQAFAAGAASIPGPFTDSDWDGWQTWISGSARFEFGDATGFELQSEIQQVDSKAMRKVTDGETIVVMAESQAGAFQVSAPIRLLMKLS